MSSQTSNLKQEGERLHQRLLAGSHTATSEIAELFMHLLIKSLSREFNQISDQHLIDMATTDALINYFQHPEKFESAKSSLFTYLRVRAKTYLLNSLGQPLSSKKVVELQEAETVYQMADENTQDAEAAVVSNALQAEVMQQVQKYITDPTDLHVANLMIQGIRETTAYAKVLGIADRPFAEQKKTVKRHKDRINKIIERKIKPGLLRRRQ
jgi:RNA polymerase sigma-70 factor (ECF subfamily)